MIVYIHLNPIKHGFSSNLNYPYSSYNAIISNKFTNVKRNDVISYFDDVENFKYWHDLQKDRVKKILNLMEEEF